MWNEHYYDPEFGGVKWRTSQTLFAAWFRQAKDDKDFYSVLDRMTAKLHDAHTRFSSPGAMKNRKKHQGVSIGSRAAMSKQGCGAGRFPDYAMQRAHGVEPE